MTNRIDWDKLNKINVRELTDAQTKHLVCKALIVQRILLKYRGKLNWIRIYTEMPIGEGKKIADVYMEDIKNKSIICYEVQSEVSKSWLKETTEIYKNIEVYNMVVDWVLVDLNLLSDNIQELKKELDKLIV